MNGQSKYESDLGDCGNILNNLKRQATDSIYLNDDGRYIKPIIIIGMI